LDVTHYDDIAVIPEDAQKELYALQVRFFNEHRLWVSKNPRKVPFACFRDAVYTDTYYLVARCAGRIVGFVSGRVTADVTTISTVFVLFDFREFGIAQYLLNKVIANRAHRSVVATVFARNRAARRLFARIGFKHRCSRGWYWYHFGDHKEK